MTAAITGNSSAEEACPELRSTRIYCSERKGHGRVSDTNMLRPHSSAAQVFARFPETADYKVVVCVRNPYSRVISFFWWRLERKGKIGSILRNSPAPLQTLALNFFALTFKPPGVFQLQHQLSGVKGSRLRTIRYEALESDIRVVADELGLDSSGAIPELKTGLNPLGAQDPKVTLWRATRAILHEKLAWEFDRFGYRR